MLKLSGKCDGIVLMDQVVGDDVLAELCAMLPVACIAHQPSDVGATMVLPDNVCGIDQIVDHLVAEHRVTSLAFLSGPEGNIDADMRRDALVARAALHGLAVSPLENWRGDYGPGTAFDIGSRCCDRGERLPDAIVCANDASASGVVAALHDAGLSVPGDVAVTGFDDMEIASAHHSLADHRAPAARPNGQCRRRCGGPGDHRWLAVIATGHSSRQPGRAPELWLPWRHTVSLARR